MKIKLHHQIFIGLLLGLLVGFFLNNAELELPASPTAEIADAEIAKIYNFKTRILDSFELIGSLFIKLLKMLIVPLIFSSIVVGICRAGKIPQKSSQQTNEEGHFARLGLKTFLYYFATSIISIVIGLLLVNLLKPGLSSGKPNPSLVKIIQQNEDKFSTKGQQSSLYAVEEKNRRKPLGFFGDLLQRMIPSNPFKAATNNSAMLSLITLALLCAFSILKISRKNSSKTEGFLAFFEGLNAISLQITGWVMRLAPLGIFCLIGFTIGKTGLGLLKQMLSYFFTVLLALSIHFFVILPILLFFIAKINPIRQFGAMKEALLMAFSTASSSATLPVTLRCLQQNAGVSKRTASFVLPLGATVNMDGTALYECVAVIFITQIMGFDLGFAGQASIVIMALLTSVGVAGVPSASLVAIVLIINNIGLSGAEPIIGAIYSVDRILDMSRTALNVFSDSCGAAIIAKSEGETLFSD